MPSGFWEPRVFTKYIKVNLSVSYEFPCSHLKLKESVQQLFSFLCGGRPSSL